MHSQHTPSDLVAFDFETATDKMNSACALGVAVLNSAGEIKEEKYWLIQPPNNYYSTKNIAIHGITPEQTKNTPTFAELWPEILPYFKSKDLIAHYVLFDAKVLAACLAFAKQDVPEIGKVYCSCITARRALPELANHKLPTVCQKLGIPLLRHHNALDDVRACGMIAHKLKHFGLAGMSWQQAQDHSFYRKEFLKKA